MPTYRTSTGYDLEYRVLPPDFLPALRARVRGEYAATEPQPPTVRIETAPGVWAEAPVDPAGELPTDPELASQVVAYRQAHAAWEATVLQEITRRAQQVLARTVKVAIDPEQVREIRELYDLAGAPLDEHDDHYVMLWYVALTDVADQAAVTQSLQGISVGEAAAAARRMFRRELGWEAD